ncbi:MAG: N-acetylmuramoyl-L-alanine amidase [Clostridia bacterium]|nr:N-acetylmuramoyl-L-alanine amidase [Clostridia bacterium]
MIKCKRLFTLLLSLILILSFAVMSVNAASEITLICDNKKIFCDVPPVIENDRTLVPVRAISEASGAEIGWNSKEKKVTILYENTTVTLFIDSKSAYVSGKEIILDAPAKIIKDRTFVPVRFIGETFGYTVGWNEETRTVSLTSPPENNGKLANLTTIGSQNTENGYRITLKFDAPLSGEYTVFDLTSPDRVIIDVENAQIDYSRQYDFANETVKDARAGNHDNYLRVVIDLDKKAKYKTYLSEKKDAIIFFFDVESDEEIEKEPDENQDATPPKEEGEYVVVIDAGHGGSDPGALGKENGEVLVKEADVNLQVALFVRDILEENGVTVVMTREKKTETISLSQRCKISNDNKADLFISIHSNAMDEGMEYVNGTMVFYGKNKDANNNPWIPSKTLAKNILDLLYPAIDTMNLGIQEKGDELAVIRGTEAPAVLVELAFITNAEDREKLMSTKYMQKAGNAIAQGILDTLGI